MRIQFVRYLPRVVIRARTRHMDRDIEGVLALIDLAFAGLQRDEDCTLHQAQLLDQTMSREISEEEWAAAKGLDPQTDWRDVPAASLDECDAVLSHASPQSWLFYIPAYMKRALELLDDDSIQSNQGPCLRGPPGVLVLAKKAVAGAVGVVICTLSLTPLFLHSYGCDPYDEYLPRPRSDPSSAVDNPYPIYDCFAPSPFPSGGLLLCSAG